MWNLYPVRKSAEERSARFGMNMPAGSDASGSAYIPGGEAWSSANPMPVRSRAGDYRAWLSGNFEALL